MLQFHNQSYYDILNISQDATILEIKSAYKSLVVKYHPDILKTPDASERFKKIVRAYTILKDGDLRSQYDKIYRTGIDFIPKLKLDSFIGRITRKSEEFASFIRIFFKNISGKPAVRHLKEYNNNVEMKFDTHKLSEELVNMESGELIDRLRYSSNSYVKINALIALGYKGERVSLPFISENIYSDNTDVACAAVWAITGLKMNRSTDLLIKAFTRIRYSDVKSAIIKAVFRVEPLHSYVLYDFLVKAINDEDESVSVTGLNMLGETGKKVLYDDIKYAVKRINSVFAKSVIDRLVNSNRILNYNGR